MTMALLALALALATLFLLNPAFATPLPLIAATIGLLGAIGHVTLRNTNSTWFSANKLTEAWCAAARHSENREAPDNPDSPTPSAADNPALRGAIAEAFGELLHRMSAGQMRTADGRFDVMAYETEVGLLADDLSGATPCDKSLIREIADEYRNRRPE